MKIRNIAGWIALSVSTIFASLWAFWGIIENFHEGWLSPSLWENIALMFVQYLSPMLIFLIMALISLRWPKIGGTLHMIAGLAIPTLLVQTNAAYLFIGAPLFLLGTAYFFGKPEPKKWAYRIAIGVPLLVTIIFAIEPIYRVSGRFDDGLRGERLLDADGVKLIWAPEGPGWTKTGTDWFEAGRISAHLTEDGCSLSDSALNIWRLPTAEECVRSLTRHGENAGGKWDSASAKPTYEIMPDKETPLWDRYSMIIYWWTATEKSEDLAYRVVYNGYVNPIPKKSRWGSLGFRAVREPRTE